MFTFLVIALAAMALAIGSWFRPLPSTKASAPPAPIYTDQQVASAKANVCTAFEKIEHAVNLSDNERASSSDRTAQLAAAALARQVLDFGSRYLLGYSPKSQRPRPTWVPRFGSRQTHFKVYLSVTSMEFLFPTQTCNRP